MAPFPLVRTRGSVICGFKICQAYMYYQWEEWNYISVYLLTYSNVYAYNLNIIKVIHLESLML